MQKETNNQQKDEVDDITDELQQLDTEEEVIIDENDIAETIDIPEIKDDSIHIFSEHKDAVYAVAIHPTNKNLFISGSGDDTASLWKTTPNKKNAEKLFQLTGHKDSITNVGFNYDGKIVATGAMDGTVKLWNVNTGKLMITLEGPSEAIEWFEWHPKGNVILAGSTDSTCWLWNEKGKCLQVFGGHSGTVSCGCFTSDGKYVLTGSEDKSVKTWDPKTGQCMFTFSDKKFSEAPILALVSKPDDPKMFLSGAEDGTAQLCNIKANKVVGTVKGHKQSVEAVDFCTTMPLFCTAGMDGCINIYDVSTLNLRGTLKHGDGVTKALFNPKEPILYSCSVDNTLAVWDVRSGKQVKLLSGHEDMVLDFDISSDGSLVVSGSDDNTARVFSLL